MGLPEGGWLSPKHLGYRSPGPGSGGWRAGDAVGWSWEQPHPIGERPLIGVRAGFVNPLYFASDAEEG